MMIVAARVDISNSVNDFIENARISFGKNTSASQFSSGTIKQYIVSADDSILVYGFKIMVDLILFRYIAAILALIQIVFFGVSLWLIFPIVLFFVKELVVLIAKGLLSAGLKKAGYKKRLKFIKASTVLEEVLF